MQIQRNLAPNRFVYTRHIFVHVSPIDSERCFSLTDFFDVKPNETTNIQHVLVIFLGDKPESYA